MNVRPRNGHCCQDVKTKSDTHCSLASIPARILVTEGRWNGDSQPFGFTRQQFTVNKTLLLLTTLHKSTTKPCRTIDAYVSAKWLDARQPNRDDWISNDYISSCENAPRLRQMSVPFLELVVLRWGSDRWEGLSARYAGNLVSLLLRIAGDYIGSTLNLNGVCTLFAVGAEWTLLLREWGCVCVCVITTGAWNWLFPFLIALPKNGPINIVPKCTKQQQ